jgi:hypothetical protein
MQDEETLPQHSMSVSQERKHEAKLSRTKRWWRDARRIPFNDCAEDGMELYQKPIFPLLKQRKVPSKRKWIAFLPQTSSQSGESTGGIGPNCCAKSRVIASHGGVHPLLTKRPTKPGMERATLLQTRQHTSVDGSRRDPYPRRTTGLLHCNADFTGRQ